MTDLTGYDAAYPPSNPPAADACCFYGAEVDGVVYGDPDHVWTQAEIDAITTRYRLPIFVQSNPGPASHVTDANGFVAWLKSIGCPTGVATVLDLEEGVTPTYVTGFGAVMHAAGYLVLPYGSTDYLFGNPELDGYFPASPGASAIPSGSVAVQYAEDVDGGAYDLDWITASIPLWDTAPTPIPIPAPTTVGGDVQITTVPVPTGPTGSGWVLTDIPWAGFVAATGQGSYPPVDGYWSATVSAQDRTNKVCVTVMHAPANATIDVFVAFAS